MSDTPKTTESPYRTLMKKYMRWVAEEEGSFFDDDFGLYWTPEEKAEIQLLAQEVKSEQ